MRAEEGMASVSQVLERNSEPGLELVGRVAVHSYGIGEFSI